MINKSITVCGLLLVGLCLSGCDPYYAGVTNNYPDKVMVNIHTNAPDSSKEVSLNAGSGFEYQSPSVVITGIDVVTPDGKQKSYTSSDLAKAAPNLDALKDRIVWSVNPGGVVPKCVVSVICCTRCDLDKANTK